MSKKHSPPPPSRPASTTTTPKLSSTEASSSHPKPLPTDHSSRIANRRVRFTPEANNERFPDQNDNTRSNDPATYESPARKLPSTQVVQSDEGSPSQIPDKGREHAADIAFSLAPIRRSSHKEKIAAVEEISSDESERSDDRNPETAQAHVPSQKDNSIRSGIEDLLKANKEVPMVDVDTANALVSLLSQMDGDNGNRLVPFAICLDESLSLQSTAKPQIGQPNHTDSNRSKVCGCQTPRSFSLTAHQSDPRTEATPTPTRTVREFQSSTGKGETVWWESRSEGNLAGPPHDVERTVGDLYIHRSATESLIQIWICRDSGSWEKVTLEYDDKYHPDRVIKGLSHPSFSDRRLKLRKNGEPSWIMKQTCATIKSRRKGAQ